MLIVFMETITLQAECGDGSVMAGLLHGGYSREEKEGCYAYLWFAEVKGDLGDDGRSEVYYIHLKVCVDACNPQIV